MLDLDHALKDKTFPIDLRDGVIWAFRLLLGREPNDEAAVQHHLDYHRSVESLRDAFINSPEYFIKSRPGIAPAARAVFERFTPYCDMPAPAGSFHDFMGIRTRCEYLPAPYVSWSGTVGGPPGSKNGPMHDAEEWLGTLRSVLEARDRLVVVELGAGWAPWLVAGARAAEKVGIGEVRLIGVEGSTDHVTFMHSHFSDNGIDPAAHRLLHAVVGVEDGVAKFPKAEEPNEDYGSVATYADEYAADEREMVEVRCISLATLLKDTPTVDIMHCDVQGAEGEVLGSALQTLNSQVRRIVVGTHSRKIEADLLGAFSGQNWRLEDETVCKLVQDDAGKLLLLADGCQVWRNPRL